MSLQHRFATKISRRSVGTNKRNLKEINYKLKLKNCKKKKTCDAYVVIDKCLTILLLWRCKQAMTVVSCGRGNVAHCRGGRPVVTRWRRSRSLLKMRNPSGKIGHALWLSSIKYFVSISLRVSRHDDNIRSHFWTMAIKIQEYTFILRILMFFLLS